MNPLRTVISIGSVIVLTVVLHYLGVLSSAEQFLRGIASPGLKSAYALRVSLEGESFDTVEELLTAYQAAKQQIGDVLSLQLALEELEQENKELREQLLYVEKASVQHIGADIIARNIDPVGSSIVINRGESDGIAIGQPAVVGKGTFIGKISSVTPSTAIIHLLDDNQSKVGAKVAGSEKTLGVVEGGFGISVRMNFIPQNEPIAVGDLIITSGLERELPSGLLIGTVASVEKEPYKPFQQAVLIPSADFDTLSTVSIITQHGI